MLQKFDVLIELNHSFPVWLESELGNHTNLKMENARKVRARGLVSVTTTIITLNTSGTL